MRLRTLQATQSTYVALPVDARRRPVRLRRTGCDRPAGRPAPEGSETPGIAATARAVGVPVYTQDRDFDDLSVDVVRV